MTGGPFRAKRSERVTARLVEAHAYEDKRAAGVLGGFVAARVLESGDRTSIAAIVEMRTAEDRQRVEQLPDVRETLHHLHGTANIVIRLYHEVAAFHV